MDKQTVPLLTPLKRERLNEKVISQLKGFIFSGVIEAGQKLPSERDLAERLGVSRVVVREALRSLEQSGLIEIRSGATGGAFVVYNLYLPLSNSAADLVNSGKLKLSHFVDARQAVECFGVRLAAERATEEQINQLHLINQRLIADIEDRAKFREHNMLFHTTIAELSGNPLILLIVQSLFELLNRLRHNTVQTVRFARATYRRHEAIVAAMRERDPVLCGRMMAADAQQTRRLKSMVQP